MVRPLSVLRALFLLLALQPAVASALQVGPLRVLSVGGQPLAGEVWVEGSAAELADLVVHPATPELYAAAHLPYPALAGQLSLAIEKRDAERSLIVLRTREAIAPGPATLLLDLRWPGGGLVRGYAIVLDDAGSHLPASDAAPPPQTERRAVATDVSASPHPVGTTAAAAPAPLAASPSLARPAHRTAAAPPSQATPRLRIAPTEQSAAIRRVAALEEALADQAQHSQDQDERLRKLEELIVQLNTLIALQRQQLASASAPVAAELARGVLAASPPAAGPSPVAPRAQPWYRWPAVQLAVIGFALFSFSALLFTVIEERLATARRRKRRAERARRAASSPSPLPSPSPQV